MQLNKGRWLLSSLHWIMCKELKHQPKRNEVLPSFERKLFISVVLERILNNSMRWMDHTLIRSFTHFSEPAVRARNSGVHTVLKTLLYWQESLRKSVPLHDESSHKHLIFEIRIIFVSLDSQFAHSNTKCH